MQDRQAGFDQMPHYPSWLHLLESRYAHSFVGLDALRVQFALFFGNHSQDMTNYTKFMCRIIWLYLCLGFHRFPLEEAAHCVCPLLVLQHLSTKW